MGSEGARRNLETGEPMSIPRLAAALAICLVASEGLAQSSQFKGWETVSRELSVRIAPKDKPLQLDQFLPVDSMDELLGTWSTFGTEHTFRNGVPNALNLMIWHVGLSRFSNAVGQSCTTPSLEFHPRFMATLQKLCRWPAAEARDEAVLLEFWTSVMGHSASADEYIAWRDFFTGEYGDRAAAETIAAMTLAITMNPRFLLHR